MSLLSRGTSVQDVRKTKGQLIQELTELRHRVAHFEAELRESEARFRALAETAADAVIAADDDGKVILWNRAAETIFGYAPDEILGQPLTTIMPRRFRSAHRKALERIVSSGEGKLIGKTIELRALRKDGVEFPVELSLGTWEVGGRRFFSAIVRDITARIAATNARYAIERRYRQLLDDSPVCFWATNVDGSQVSLMSRGVKSLYGYEPEDFYTRPALLVESVHPEDLPTVLKVTEQVRKSKRAGWYECRVRRKDGVSRWMRNVLVPELDKDGNLVGLHGFAVDVTAEIGAQIQLKAERDLSDRAIESVPGIFYLIDRDGRFVRWNENFERVTGYTSHEIPLMHPTDFFAGADKTLIADRIEQVFDTGTATAEADLIAKDGTRKTFYFTGQLVKLDEKPHLVGMGIDISERKEAEEALRKSEASYREFVEGAGHGIYRSTPAGRFLAANPAAIRMLGYESEKEILALDITRDVYAAPTDREKVLQRMAASDRFEGIEVTWKRKDGTPITAELSGRTVRDEKGRIQYFEVHAEDVTERRVVEQQLRQAQKMEAIGRLAGGLAHDFNNLLTVILGESEMALEEAGGRGGLEESLREIRKAGRRAVALTRQLLAFSRRQILEAEVFSLNDLVADAEKMLRRLIEENIRLETRLEGGLGVVEADRGQIEQVLMNLAVNARDAMPDGGTLTIETANATLDETNVMPGIGATPGEYVLLSVTDTGVGMTDEVKAQIFEPFFTTKEKGTGTGLGLATCYGIVKQAGGYIAADSNPGIGTTMSVYLPRAAPDAHRVETEPQEAELPRGTEKILLVEDDGSVRRVGARILRRLGYSVIEAETGEDALALMEEHGQTIDLLLTDVVLPGIGGRDLAQQAQSMYPAIKVLFASGYTRDAVLQRQTRERRVILLQKPFTLQEMASKVRKALDG